MTTPSNNSQMHNDIMEAGSKERLPMLAPGNYAQWSSRFMRYIDTKPNNDQLRQCIEKGPYILIELVTSEVPAEGDNPVQPQGVREETYLNTTPKNKKLIDAEAEAIHMILNEIGDNIYSTVDACPTAQEMWLAIERLQQGESINKQDVKTKLMINEIVRNKLKVDTMQVNVQFLQQLQPKWSRFVTIVKQQSDLDTVSFHKLFDILKQHQNEMTILNHQNLTKPIHTHQDKHHQPRTHATIRNKGKEIVKPPLPQSESASEEDSDEERAQRDKQIQKSLALIPKHFKNIYKPTFNNLKTSLNTRNKNVDTYLRTENDDHTGKFGNQRTVTVAENRETQESKGIPLSAEQDEWLQDTDEEPDEQELEAHYMYMAKI
ncbi:hypothetical protein Tco_0317695 [Tanacetum coccineum]